MKELQRLINKQFNLYMTVIVPDNISVENLV